MKVLIVDDDSYLRAELLDALLMANIDAEAATAAPQAIACIAADPGFTVVVSDMLMPGMDGLELSQALRKMCPDAVGIEVLLITGHRAVEIEPGLVHSVLYKPIGLKALLASVRAADTRAMQRRGVQDCAADYRCA